MFVSRRLLRGKLRAARSPLGHTAILLRLSQEAIR
jgi:hypothetical protein